MQELHQGLERLEDKMAQLVQKIEYLRKENIMLIDENVKIKQELEKYKVEHAANNRGSGEDKSGGNAKGREIEAEKMRRDLEKYITEVDKCIELINHM